MLVLGFCFYVRFLAKPDEGNRQFAEKIIFAIIAFMTGNAVPKLFSDIEEKKAD